MDPVVGASLISVAGGLLNNLFQSQSMDKQVSAQKDLMRYQWDNFSSPSAQAKAYAAAGFNPATALGNGNITSASPSAPSVTPPQFSVGIENLSELGSFMKSVADAKKAGVDTHLSEQEIRNKQVQQKRDEFELNLRKTFGKSESVLNLANAYQQVLLAQDSHDLNLKEKALKDWQKAKEKALSELSEHERDIAAKRLANTDIELKLQNEESKARANASNASAEASRTQADVNRENRRLQSALADIEEGAKFDKIQALIAQYQKEGWLSESDASEARIRASRLHDVENKRESKFFKAIDDYSEWLKSKLKIFSK